MRLHLSGCTAPKQERAGDEIGCVEAGGGEGDDVFEDGGRANVDEGDEGGNYGHEGDGNNWDRGARFDLQTRISNNCIVRDSGLPLYFADVSMEGKTSISGKRPDHARCGREEPNDRTPGEGNYDRSHHRRSCFGFDSVVEDLNEREAGG